MYKTETNRFSIEASGISHLAVYEIKKLYFNRVDDQKLTPAKLALNVQVIIYFLICLTWSLLERENCSTKRGAD